MIHVLDELTVRPGRMAALRHRLVADYVPAARERGMTLIDVWTTPPIELHDEPTQLVVLWSLPDVAAWWAMRRAAGADAAVGAFWSSIQHDVVARTRRMLASTPLDGTPAAR